ncbi:hypothetical protein Tco_0038927 [Tanacetum coccineum]
MGDAEKTAALKTNVYKKAHSALPLCLDNKLLRKSFGLKGAIHLSRNAMFHERTKHINMRYHFIREIMESREIEVAKIGT